MFRHQTVDLQGKHMIEQHQTEPSALPFDVPDSWATDGAELNVAEPLTCLTFDLSGQIFAVDVIHVREILDMQPISALPNAGSDLLGMIDVRGEGIALIDLASRLGMMRTDGAEHSRIIVLEIGTTGAQVPVGVIADRVVSVVELAEADIEPPPMTLVRWDGDAVRGVVRLSGQIVMLLQLTSLFDAEPPGPFDFS
jgi:purine-binding chemotaxis protein CheW